MFISIHKNMYTNHLSHLDPEDSVWFSSKVSWLKVNQHDVMKIEEYI